MPAKFPHSDQPDPVLFDGYTMDAVDEQIVACLREDGRMSNLELAQRTGVSEKNVRQRLRRLEELKIARVALMLDLRADGFEFIAPVGIKVKGRAPHEVGADIAKIPAVSIVILATGAHDLEIQVLATSLEELDALLNETISAIPGVEQVTPALSTRISKHEYQWVPFS